MPNDMDREIASKQTHCYTCGKKFDRVKYEYPVCGEWQCSEECREKHKTTMDNV